MRKVGWPSKVLFRREKKKKKKKHDGGGCEGARERKRGQRGTPTGAHGGLVQASPSLKGAKDTIAMGIGIQAPQVDGSA